MIEEQVERKEDAGNDEAAIVAYWIKEIELSDKAEEDWRKYAQHCVELFEGESQKRYASNDSRTRNNEFNIFWSNTETLKPALYNSTPRPDIRRRFRDKDPVGRAVAEVLERGISYCIDSYDFDAVIEDVVQDYLVTGRGLARVRYVPVFADQTQQQVVYDEVLTELVEWDKVRFGYAKRWNKLPWVGFEHELTRDDLIQRFGDQIGNAVGLDIERKTDDKDAKSDQFKRARVWEIWNKDKREVLFVAPSYKASPLKRIPDPLKLRDFWPIPRPLCSIHKTTSLIPTAEYSLYEAQAEELDRITRRINRIINALKVRGIYDSTISEMGSLFDQDDNKFIPATNVAQLYNQGGLDKAIWMLPLDKIIVVLRELVQQREAIKAVIYEITGISDILRGASDPTETLGAQEIKQNWAGLRLQRRQKEVQRFVRDLIRLKAEIIAERFAPQTLQLMSGMELPSMADKAAAQQAVQQAQAMQQPPDPKAMEVLSVPSWEDVIEVLHDDAVRAYRIDIETDSTIEGARQDEQKNVVELLEGISNFANAITPSVQGGLLPVDAAKAIMLSVVRRFKLGREVEDEIDKMGGQPVQNPEMEKMQQELEARAQELEQGARDLQQEQMNFERDVMKRDFDLTKRELELQKNEEILAIRNEAFKSIRQNGATTQ